MAIDTGAFVAGVGLLVTLDLAVLGISIQNARAVGVDDVAREAASSASTLAREAEEQAQSAHDRHIAHLREHHGGDVETGREAYAND